MPGRIALVLAGIAVVLAIWIAYSRRESIRAAGQVAAAESTRPSASILDPSPAASPPGAGNPPPPATAQPAPGLPGAQALAAPADKEDPAKPTRRTQPAQLRKDGIRVTPGADDLVRELNSETVAAPEDLEILQNVFTAYRRVFGENPTGGLNAEIVGGLTGNNARKLAILPPDLDAINAEGELLDRWGTPFFFHPVSRQIMEVHSAGPDGVLWTSDDVSE